MKNPALPYMMALLLGAAALSPAAGMSAEIRDVLAQIAANNRELRSARSQAEADNLELRSENTLSPTSIEYSPFFRGGESGVASSELIVQQEFDFPTLYAARSKEAAMEHKAAMAGVDARRREILLEARDQLLDLILLRNQKLILSKRLQTSSALLDLWQKAFDAGKVNILEVNKARLEIQDLEREILLNDIAQSEIIDALTVLNGGIIPDTSGIRYESDALQLQLPASAAETAAADPAVAAADARVKAARQGVATGKGSWAPSIALGYRRNTEGSEASNGFLVGASFPLFSAGKKVKAANARLVAAEMEAEDVVASTLSNRSAELKRIQVLQRTLATYDSPLLQETLNLYHRSLEHKQITLTEYYTQTNLLYDRLQARAELENRIHKLATQFTLTP